MHDLFRAVARMVAGAECSSHAVFGRGDRWLEGLRADRVRPTGTACRPDRRADWLTPAIDLQLSDKAREMLADGVALMERLAGH